jgi:sporulation protein YlmC with PRC-barrel domain
MIVKYSQIIHSPVLELKGQTRLGIVADLVIQKSDLTIKAVIVKNGLLNVNTRIATNADIIELNSGSVILRDDDSLVTFSEAERVKEAIKDKMYGVSQKVRTKSGKSIGRVYDYTIDNATCAIQKFYVKSLLDDRIISVGSIIKFEGKNITVKDDFELITAAGPAFTPEIA